MRTLLFFFVACALALPAMAQGSPIQIKIEVVSKKRDSGGSIVRDIAQRRALRITLQNITPQPLFDLTLRWAIIKSRSGAAFGFENLAFGADEKVHLQAHEQKIIETDEVQVMRLETTSSAHQRGEKFEGHGVQILREGKVIAEMIVPTSLKKSMENIKPVKSDSPMTNRPPVGKRKGIGKAFR